MKQNKIMIFLIVSLVLVFTTCFWYPVYSYCQKISLYADSTIEIRADSALSISTKYTPDKTKLDSLIKEIANNQKIISNSQNEEYWMIVSLLILGVFVFFGCIFVLYMLFVSFNYRDDE